MAVPRPLSPRFLPLLWLSSHVPAYQQLPPALLRKTASYLRILLFHSFIADDSWTLYLFSIPDRTSAEVSLSVRVLGAGSCFLTHTSIIACGEYPISPRVVCIDCTSGAGNQLASMCFSRLLPEVAKLSRNVYVFAGCLNNWRMLKTCEKLPLATNTWTRLPDIPHPPRFPFKSCKFHRTVYLCLPDSGVIEAFRTATETFTSIPIPMVTGKSTSVLANGELVIVSKSANMVRWPLESWGGAQVSKISMDAANVVMGARRGLCIGDKLYWVARVVFESGMDVFNRTSFDRENAGKRESLTIVTTLDALPRAKKEETYKKCGKSIHMSRYAETEECEAEHTGS